MRKKLHLSVLILVFLLFSFSYVKMDWTVTFASMGERVPEVAEVEVSEESPEEAGVSVEGTLNPEADVIVDKDENSSGGKQKERAVRKESTAGNVGESAALTQTKNVEAIFLDGVHGDDANDGTLDYPVKTFEIAKRLLEEKNVDKIYIKGTVNISNRQEWSLKQGKIFRYPGHAQELVKILDGGDLSLTNITINGSAEQGSGGSYSLVKVESNGNFVMGEGVTLENNDRSNFAGYSCGGAVEVRNGGNFLMSEGAVIRSCRAAIGGGVFTEGKFAMTGGKIESCQAEHKIFGDHASGGGVAVSNTGLFEFSGGRIENNRSEVNGGGIGLGSLNRLFSSTGSPILVMTGGEVLNNTSLNGAGGGLYIQCNGRANISGGEFSGNQALGGLYSGGAIYVNGGFTNILPNGVLKLTNVLITKNEAGRNGGGLAACPTSTTNIYEVKGGAIYQNTAGGVGADLTVRTGAAGFHVGKSVFHIAPYMLGGGSYDWRGEENELIDHSLLKGVDGELSLHTLKGTNDSDTDIVRAAGLAQVRIHDNYGIYNGGAIASNGNVEVGLYSPHMATVEFLAGEHGTLEGETVYRVNLEEGVHLRDLSPPTVIPHIGYKVAAQTWGDAYDPDSMVVSPLKFTAQYEKIPDIIPATAHSKPAGYITIQFLAGKNGTLSGETVYYINPKAQISVADLEIPRFLPYSMKNGSLHWTPKLPSEDGWFKEDMTFVAEWVEEPEETDTDIALETNDQANSQVNGEMEGEMKEGLVRSAPKTGDNLFPRALAIKGLLGGALILLLFGRKKKFKRT